MLWVWGVWLKCYFRGEYSLSRWSDFMLKISKQYAASLFQIVKKSNYNKFYVYGVFFLI